MRDLETIEAAITTAETGHLVLATLHSGGVAEALQRLVGAFAPEVQHSMCAQLADVLVGVVAQRLRFHEGAGLLVPECEVLMGTTASRAIIRSGQFFKLTSTLEAGAAEGHFTFARYGDWLARKTDFAQPVVASEPSVEPPLAPPSMRPVGRPAPIPRRAPATVADDGALDLTGEGEDLSAVLAELEKES